MYQAQKALFFYCVSPVHMGAGTAIGLIDNPIQRERHTEYPLLAGSGLKGAVRHHFAGAWGKERMDLIDRLFGPETSDFAGAVSFGDAQLVAFPVRCTRRAYVYATSPTALARAKRLLTLSGDGPGWPDIEVAAEHCAIANPDLLGGNGGKQLILETFELQAAMSQPLMQISQWLADHALPPGDAYAFFREKLKLDLVVLPDDDFGYFVRNATVVEPHVRIDDKTGTADGGRLFYTENLPPESLLLAPLMASAERSSTKKRNGAKPLTAEDVMDAVVQGGGNDGLDGLLLQVGGDATTGRGQVVVRAV
jgi:CRISPR-associated protein Cmr4